MSREPFAPGGFEFESRQFLTARWHVLPQMSREDERFDHPRWNWAIVAEDHWNPAGGWTESGRVVARLRESALAAGVAIYENTPFTELVMKRVRGREALDAGGWNGGLMSWCQLWARGTVSGCLG